jgi:hypothetical protein
MADEQTNSGAGGSPSGTPSGNASSNFIATRSRQITEQMERQPAPAPGDQAAADATGDTQNERAREQQQQARQSPPAEQKIRVGDDEYTSQELSDAIAERAEAQSRRATLPANAADYRAELSPNFVPPEGIKFEINKSDLRLKAAAEFAHKYGLGQEAYSELIGIGVSGEIGAAQRNGQLRDVNMRQLGPAAPQRVEAVATWLTARAGVEGKAMGNFLRQNPAAPMVKAMEALMRQFSNQGDTAYSPQHREVEDTSGKIPGYENMSFVERRVHQMALMQQRQPPGGRRGGQ